MIENRRTYLAGLVGSAIVFLIAGGIKVGELVDDEAPPAGDSGRASSEATEAPREPRTRSDRSPVFLWWIKTQAEPELVDMVDGIPIAAPFAAEILLESNTAWLVLYREPQSSVWVGPRRFPLEQPKVIKIGHPRRAPFYDPGPWPEISGPPSDRGLRLIVEFQRGAVGRWRDLANAIGCALIDARGE